MSLLGKDLSHLKILVIVVFFLIMQLGVTFVFREVFDHKLDSL